MPIEAGATLIPDWCRHGTSPAAVVTVEVLTVGEKMSEREAGDGPLCSRPDPAYRGHKHISKSKGTLFTLKCCVQLLYEEKYIEVKLGLV